MKIMVRVKAMMLERCLKRRKTGPLFSWPVSCLLSEGQNDKSLKGLLGPSASKLTWWRHLTPDNSMNLQASSVG